MCTLTKVLWRYYCCHFLTKLILYRVMESNSKSTTIIGSNYLLDSFQKLKHILLVHLMK